MGFRRILLRSKNSAQTDAVVARCLFFVRELYQLAHLSLFQYRATLRSVDTPPKRSFLATSAKICESGTVPAELKNAPVKPIPPSGGDPSVTVSLTPTPSTYPAGHIRGRNVRRLFPSFCSRCVGPASWCVSSNRPAASSIRARAASQRTVENTRGEETHVATKCAPYDRCRRSSACPASYVAGAQWSEPR